MAISLDSFFNTVTKTADSITGNLVKLKEAGVGVSTTTDGTQDFSQQFADLKTSFQQSQTPPVTDSGDVQKLIDALSRRDSEAPFSAKNILMGTVVIVAIIGVFAFFTRKKK